MNNEQVEFLKKIAIGRTCLEIAEIMNKEFSTNYKASNIKYYKRKYNIKSGVDMKFKKGCEPHNMKDTGYEFVNNQYGYTFIKNEYNKFELKQRYLYRTQIGNIPDGYSVIFKDCNRSNFDLDNLVLVKNDVMLTMKNQHLFSTDPSVTETGVLVGELINAVSRKKGNMYEEKERNTKNMYDLC